MSGPPYPKAQDNSVGKFIIGISPIGSQPTFDFWKTIISQYSNSTILTRLIENFFQYIDQTTDFDAFFDMIWNVDTAQGFGLDVWGRIVGVSRTLHVQATEIYFGFQDALPGSEGFNVAPFFSGQPLTSNFDLSDSAYRTLIFAKALANISDGSIPSINQLLLNLFPGAGNCYVTDGQDMSMTYTFLFFLSPVDLAIVQNSGVLPKPVGVSATVVQGF